MKIVFMGTPDFAVPTLEALYKKGFYINAVVTQPDKPKGRGKKLMASAVKLKAEEHGIDILQPFDVKNLEFINILKDINPDIISVIAFGQILPKEILNIPKHGCINVHASLLPKLRGAAPINWSIINGDSTTGVTTMFMDEGLDTGDIILQKEIEIGADETAGELFKRLAALGAEVLIETINLVEENKIERIKQNHDNASYAPMMAKETGKIDWSLDAKTIKNLIRGTYPWPGAYSFYNGNMFKIFIAEVLENNSFNEEYGIICEVLEDCFIVKCKRGFLKVKEVQFQNKKRMSVEAYLRGNMIKKGEKLS